MKNKIMTILLMSLAQSTFAGNFPRLKELGASPSVFIALQSRVTLTCITLARAEARVNENEERQARREKRIPNKLDFSNVIRDQSIPFEHWLTALRGGISMTRDARKKAALITEEHILMRIIEQEKESAVQEAAKTYPSAFHQTPDQISAVSDGELIKRFDTNIKKVQEHHQALGAEFFIRGAKAVVGTTPSLDLFQAEMAKLFIFILTSSKSPSSKR